MNLKEQILNIYLAKHLQGLGVDMSDAALCHVYKTVQKCVDGDCIEETEWDVELFNATSLNMQPNIITVIPTYTLPELLDKLNEFSEDLQLEFNQSSIGFVYRISGKTIMKYRFLQIDNMINAAYHLLCWSIRQEHPEEEDDE